MKKLEDKVAIVTGSTSGIGKAIAKLFAAEGATVVVSGRNESAGAEVVNEIKSAGGVAAFQACDLTQPAACVALVQRAIREFGRLDILINNAADVSRGNIETTSLELWEKHFATNIRAPFILCQEAFRDMKPRGKGAIVNIGSLNAYCGELKLLSYSSSKGALMTFTKNIANYMAPYGVRANLVNAGWTLTEGERKVMRQDTGGDDWYEDAIAKLPFGRMFAPEDVARAALYFASDDSSIVNGSVLDMNWIPVGAWPGAPVKNLQQ